MSDLQVNDDFLLSFVKTLVVIALGLTIFSFNISLIINIHHFA